VRITDGYKVDTVNPVTLIDCMGTDALVVDAARVSFAKKAGSFTVDKNAKLIKYLWKHNHWTPFGHPQLTFHFQAPIFIARQFVKHQVGFVWNEVSRRYIDSPPTFFVPDTFRKRPDNMKQGSIAEGAVPVEGDVLKDVVDRAAEAAKDYTFLMQRGVCPEQARMFLPLSSMTEWYWTGSLAAWLRFCNLRGDSHAQAECWPYALEVGLSIKNRFPLVYDAVYGKDNNGED